MKTEENLLQLGEKLTEQQFKLRTETQVQLGEELLHLQQRTGENVAMTQFLRGVEGLLDTITFYLPSDAEEMCEVRENICMIVSALVISQCATKESAIKLHEDMINYLQDYEEYIKYDSIHFF